jgi:ceramide glucosyltransferase
VILNWTCAVLALLSLALLFWQWLVARRFPLHQRVHNPVYAPAVTLFKPLKGCDAATRDCLRSWFAQEYPGEVQILFGVTAADDPVCEVVGQLAREFPARDAQLVVCGPPAGANAKASKLAELERYAKHDMRVISDADVRVPPDFLANALAPLREPAVGLVHCFYRLSNPSTPAMQWEAVAVNADFWSQVLQSRSLKPLDFALGAVMVTRRAQLEEIGGFAALQDCLADDYQLGHRIARRGLRIALSPVVVECWDPPMTWRAVWRHQLRWARTIRVCEPVPYFFSILSNVTFWALLWFLVALPDSAVRGAGSDPGPVPGALTIEVQFPVCAMMAMACVAIRIVAAGDLQRRLTRSLTHLGWFWMTPIKDLLQAAVWVGAFLGNRIEWRGQQFRLRRDGTLKKV